MQPGKSMDSTRSILQNCTVFCYRKVELSRWSSCCSEALFKALGIKSTVKSLKEGYLEELRKRPRADDGERIVTLPTKKHGRKLFIQIYIVPKESKGRWGTVSARITLAAQLEVSSSNATSLCLSGMVD